MKACCTLIGALLFLHSAQAEDNEAEREARITKLMPALELTARDFAREWHTPGVALVVVTPERDYYVTFGVREQGRRAPINADTIFQLASVSKPITSTFAARLVSQNKLQWDTPITTLLPSFTFEDAAITHRTTIKDMLSQRSGLPAGTGDFLETLGYDQDYILQQMRHIDTAKNFRKKYAYANFGITIGGVASAAATRNNFDNAIRRELFRPAGMRTAFINYNRLKRTYNRARLHLTIDGVSRPLFVRNATPEAPGGGINASIRDMAAFLRLHLNHGKVGDKQLIDPAVLRETYEPIIDRGNGSYYGMCWNVTPPSAGVETLGHSGGFFAGCRTEVRFWPGEGIGIATLTNNFPSMLPEAISDAFYQLYTTGKVKDGTLKRFQGITRQAFNVDEDIRRIEGATDITEPVNGAPFSAYVGTYKNAYVGPVEVLVANDPDKGQPTLFFRSGPRFKPVKIQRLDNTSQLISINIEGDSHAYEFNDRRKGGFQQLVLPELQSIGWEKLQRVP